MASGFYTLGGNKTQLQHPSRRSLHTPVKKRGCIFHNRPPDLIPPQIKERIGNLYFQSYSPDKEKILVVGLVPDKKYSEIVFPLFLSDPLANKEAHFLKYPIYVGGDKGRGQIYLDGSNCLTTF